MKYFFIPTAVRNGILYTNSGQVFKTYKIKSISADIGITDNNLVVSGKTSDYAEGDKVFVTIDGTVYEAQLNDDGTFEFSMQPVYNEKV